MTLQRLHAAALCLGLVGPGLGSTLACDPTASSGAAPAKAPSKAASEESKEPEPGTPLSALPAAPESERRDGELAADSGACLSACAAGETLSPTDQATCELLCSTEVAADVTPAAAVRGRFDLCRERCASEPNDRSTCRLVCAAAAPATLDGASAEAQRCFRPCLDELGQCERTCDPTGERPTDRSTCGLNCDAAAQKCLEACPGGAS